MLINKINQLLVLASNGTLTCFDLSEFKDEISAPPTDQYNPLETRPAEEMLVINLDLEAQCDHNLAELTLGNFD
jgi:hypothetical protein